MYDFPAPSGSLGESAERAVGWRDAPQAVATVAKSRTRGGVVVRYTCALPRGWGIAMAMQRAPLSRQFEAVR